MQNCPIEHGVQALAAPETLPAPQYAPGAHAHAPLHASLFAPVALPNLPARHAPLHALEIRPELFPNRPSAQRPVHAGADMAVVAPYEPAAHATGALAPPTQKEPMGHTAPPEAVLPAAQK